MNSSKSRRRVPDQLRKRASISCDFCKLRRRKCVRLPGLENCKLCIEHRVQCASTIPRKPRGHAPTEEPDSLRSHQQALEDIVMKLCPGVNITDREEVQRLSRQISEDGQPSQSAMGAQDSPVSNVLSCNSATEPLIAPSGGLSNPAEQALQDSPATSFYECILRSPAGILSYFGPYSSMAYVRKMRELLASNTNGEIHSEPSQGLRHTFIKDHYAYTMGENQGAVPELPANGQVQPISPAPSKQGATRLLSLLKALPPKEQTDELVELFFAHVHINMVLFHRPSFQAALDQVRSPHTRTIDAGWAVCLQLAVAFGCEWRLSLIREGHTPDWERLNSLKKQLVNDSFLEISHLLLSANLQSISALALLSVYSSFANERNASWVLSGCAIRMAIGIGLHRGENVLKRSDLSLLSLETELRKQIWCSLYILDQYTSAFLGRPTSAGDLDGVFEYPKESMLDQGFYWPPGYLQHDVLLAQIVGKICQAQVDQSLSMSNDFQGLPDLNTCQKLLNNLENWKKNLPSFLEFNDEKIEHIYPNHLRQIIMLHVRYQYARILLSRPFLLKALYISNGLDGGTPPEIIKYKDICFQSAVDAWGHILSLWKRGQYNANLWLDGVFAYQCNLILGLYLLDTSKPFDIPRSQRIQQMVSHIQDILQKEPGNRTMGRLKQISRDFSEIASVMSTTPREESAGDGDASGRYQGTTSHQDRISNYPGAFLDAFPSVLQSQEDFGLSTVDFESIIESNLFDADFLNENPMFGAFSDFPFEDASNI